MRMKINFDLCLSSVKNYEKYKIQYKTKNIKYKINFKILKVL